MLYWPPESLLQAAAALANEPEGSGNTYQLSVGGPLPDEPHADSASTAMSAARLLSAPRLNPSAGPLCSPLRSVSSSSGDELSVGCTGPYRFLTRR